jgi:polyisoprenyl-teichoic acid--peptidoglycan teichoic acid transferase
MMQLASLGFNIDAKTIAKQQIPPNELVRGETIKGAQVLGVDESKLKRFIQNLLEQENKPAVTSTDSVTTKNDYSITIQSKRGSYAVVQLCLLLCLLRSGFL